MKRSAVADGIFNGAVNGELIGGDEGVHAAAGFPDVRPAVAVLGKNIHIGMIGDGAQRIAAGGGGIKDGGIITEIAMTDMKRCAICPINNAR